MVRTPFCQQSLQGGMDVAEFRESKKVMMSLQITVLRVNGQVFLHSAEDSTVPEPSSVICVMDKERCLQWHQVLATHNLLNLPPGPLMLPLG